MVSSLNGEKTPVAPEPAWEGEINVQGEMNSKGS
jgi:hypothetical protein